MPSPIISPARSTGFTTNPPPTLAPLMAALLACLHLFIATPAHADTPFVDPHSVASASGEWVLRIVPTDPQGRSSAHYTMRHNGTIAWEAEH